jgi:transcription-repair coupling factor (superfamily II helicase)
LLQLQASREAQPGHAFPEDNTWQKEFEASFPFTETPDQLKAIRESKADMEKTRPMDRLICGDVGFGKTEVAIRAAFKAVMDGRQVAVLVPTTVLAQQHYNTFRERMQAFPVRIGVLSRFHSRAEQQRVIEGVKNGAIDIVIGTHRLLQKDVSFKDLGLLIIDEEQRFGVKAKEQLKQFRREIDVLTLTATPIPRSLHMALVQVRDLSVIATPPEGRLPIKTFLEPFDEYHVREAILRELDRGGQVYFVHNRVQTIEAMAERLRHLVPHARLQIAHGQMAEGELERVMFDFASGQYDILVCSTIIESGLDIPNVNTMIINDAPQFGLAQLYQLRGRIGRGSRRGYAYLIYNANARITRIAERRLKAIFESTELGAGFQIAMIDLEIRGAGNVLGSAQHGQMVAVGFQLYAEMLTEAIGRQRGGADVAPEDRVWPTVTLPVDAYLPKDYVEDENQRLRLYQRMAAMARVAEVKELEAEIRDRFGPLPEPVTNMLATVRIRIKASELELTSIIQDPTALVLRGSPMTVYDRMAAYARYGREVRIDRGTFRLPVRLLAADPLPEIEEILDKAIWLKHQIGEAGAAGGERAPAASGQARGFPAR